MEKGVLFPGKHTNSSTHLALREEQETKRMGEKCDNIGMGSMTKDRRRASKS